MSLVFKSLAASCVGVVLICGAASIGAAPPGLLEGHLKILSLREVELADENSPTVTPKTDTQAYAEYPLIILSQEGKKEIARVTADKNGNYRVALPPGDYILDMQGRGRGHVRARAQAFTIVSNQTVHVDMDIDTGIR